MRDWRKEVREHLAQVELPPEMKEEIVAELVSHLEESENEGDQITNALDLSKRSWQELAYAIYCAKQETGMNRKSGLWIPIFVNLLLTSAIINVCDRMGMMDLRIYRVDPIPLTPQPWLLVLPICGATAAFLARRAASSPNARVIAAVAPAIIWFTAPFVVELILLCFPHTFVRIPLRSLVFSSLWLLVFPALALLLGAAPFLRNYGAKAQCE